MKVAQLTDETGDIKEKGFVVLTAEDKALMQNLMSENESLPDYDPDAETLVAEHFVVPTSGYYCKACKLFLLSSDYVDVHCRCDTRLLFFSSPPPMDFFYQMRTNDIIIIIIFFFGRTVSHYNKYIETLKQEASKVQKTVEAEGESENEKRVRSNSRFRF